MENAWIDRPEDVLVLRALRHVEHVVELAGGARIEARIRALVDEDRHGRRRYAKSRIGEVFAHELLLGYTGEPFESIEYAFREHGEAVRGDDDEQPWNAAPPLSGAETRVEVCLAEARYVERRIPFLDLPGRVRQPKVMADAGDMCGWTPIDDGPVFRYLRWIREEGDERMVSPDLRLRTEYLVELVCPVGRSVVLAEEGLRGRLEDIAANAVASARVSGRWRVGPTDSIRVKRIEYNLDECAHVPVPIALRRLARKTGIAVRFDRTSGKGSHGTLYYGDRRTVVKDRTKPLKTGTLRGMCKQLGIDPNDLSGTPIVATRFSYPIDLHKEREGGFSVTFPDFDEAFTDGDTFAEAIAEAADCLEEALAGRIARRENIPGPSPAKGRPTVVPGATLAAKAALYEAMHERRLSNSAFAVAMGVQESEVRRMLNPRHATKIGRLEEALSHFGKRLVITVEEAA